MEIKPEINYAKIKAEKIVNEFAKLRCSYKAWIPDEHNKTRLDLSEIKDCSTICCNLIIEALDDIECDENQNVMESINEEEKFYNDVIREIDKL